MTSITYINFKLPNIHNLSTPFNYDRRKYIQLIKCFTEELDGLKSKRQKNLSVQKSSSTTRNLNTVSSHIESKSETILQEESL